MRFRLLLLLAVLVHPVGVGADPIILYSNLGAGGTYDASAHWVLEDDETQEYAMQFRPVTDGSLAQVRVPLQVLADPAFEGRRGGAQLSFTLTQASLAEGGPDGEVIERWTLGQKEVNALVGATFLTLASQTSPTLSADVNYYLSGRFLSSGYTRWFRSIDATGFVFERIGGGFDGESEGGWNPIGVHRLGAFEITGSETAVPEPATLLLAGGGLAAAALQRRHRRRLE